MDRYVSVFTQQHSGISGGGEIHLVMQEIATHESVAYALDYAEQARVENRGGYGNIGCGRTWVGLSEPVDDADLDESAFDIIITGTDELPADVPTGRPQRGRLRELLKSGQNIWDGNNHVSICPSRYRALLAIERLRWR